MRGRVMGIVTLSAGLSPLGGVLAGFGADLVGPQSVTIVMSGIAVGIGILVYLLSPTVREYRLSRAIAK